jgi:class 3 adenylate cyclase
VNLAAALERVARPNQILLSRGTADAARGGSLVFREIGARELSGFLGPVEVFALSDA